MPHEFRVDVGHDRLYVRTSGSVSVAEADEMIEEARRLLRRRPVAGVLLELDHDHTETDDLALYRIARAYSEFASGRLPTAFVGGRFPGLDRYFEDVLRDQGVECALFGTRDEAERWLDRGETPARPAATPPRGAG
jgi:hypothetical protein